LPINCGTAERIGLSMILRCPCGERARFNGLLASLAPYNDIMID
jgi:hypothetical protein